MARDNHPKIRRANKMKRKLGARKGADRILIVSEGSKTEPNYFNEIRVDLRLSTANIQIMPSDYGTCPLDVATFAHDLFINGDRRRSIEPRSFDKIYSVFDRDDHARYFEALDFVESKNKKIKNDQKLLVEFYAIASIPCFELWLLLHFENYTSVVDRTQVLARLKANFADYKKGYSGCFYRTRAHLEIAKQRALNLACQYSRRECDGPCTDAPYLVDDLLAQNQK